MLFVLSGEILAIAALPHYQRKGIGTALLRQTEDLAHKLGLHRLSLHTAKENDAARLFFQGAGFKVIRTEENYYPKGQVAVTMSKVLDHST